MYCSCNLGENKAFYASDHNIRIAVLLSCKSFLTNRSQNVQEKKILEIFSLRFSWFNIMLFNFPNT